MPKKRTKKWKSSTTSSTVRTRTVAPADDELRPFFFAIDDIPAYSIAQMLEQSDAGEEDKQNAYDIFGRDLMTKVIRIVAP